MNSPVTGAIHFCPVCGASSHADHVKEAFIAGYRCNWNRATLSYNFESQPGDPDGAYAAWVRFREEQKR